MQLYNLIDPAIQFTITFHMGCIDSTAHTVELYSMLNEITKEALRNAIAEDDPVALAELQTDTTYPDALELSETGLLWTTLHFCCRFEAPQCLEYFLRKCHLLHPRQYLQFINHQTSDGSTCLHLCAIWNAQRCFALLVKYGGLNLSLKNKTHKTIIGTARDYERKRMVSVLRVLTSIHGCITPFNYLLLEEPVNCLSLKDPSSYEAILKQIVEKKPVHKKVVELTKQEKELMGYKRKVEEEKEEMHKKRLSILKETIEREESREPEGKDNEANEGPREAEQDSKASKEEVELEKEFRVKEEELSNIKRAIDLLQSQSAFKQLKSEQDKAQAGRCPEQLIFEHFVQFKSYLLTEHAKARSAVKENEKEGAGKQEVVKAKEENRDELQLPLKSTLREERSVFTSQTNDCLSPADLTHFKELPLNIQKLYLQAQHEGCFIDKQFPHSPSSLGGPEHQVKIRPFIESMQWLRPISFLGKNFKLFDGIHPNDVKQGLLGVCYCLATISNLACYPEQIQQVFPFYDLSLGFYALSFYIGGKPTFVVIDDYFPCNSSSLQPLFSKPIGKEVWVLLIEKAWAKLIGSYYAAEMMTPDQFMQDLTGYPTMGALFKNKKDKLKDILDCSGKNYPIVLTTGDKKIQNMVSSHAYSLLRVYEHEGGRLYKLRNPWGRFEWNGCYGEQSSLWTPELKLKCDFVEGDDGVFFLSEAEILQAFEYYSIGFNEKDFRYSFTEFSSSNQESDYFKFTHRGGKASIRVSQPFKRMVQDKDYNYSGLLFEVGRVAGDRVEFVSQGNDKCFRGDKSVYACNQIFRQYPAGDYFLRIKVEWNCQDKYNTAVLSVFSQEKVTFETLSAPSGEQLWMKMLLNFAQTRVLSPLNEDVSFSMHWMRGQMVCYCQLQPESKREEATVGWQFQPEQMKNCRLALGKKGNNSIEYTVSKGTGNVGTVERLELAKSCSSGKVALKLVKN